MTKQLLLVLSIPLGLVVGSVLTMVIDRAPERWPIFRPGPRCPHCEAPIEARHLVPVLSWIVLRGRCASYMLAHSTELIGTARSTCLA